MTTAVRLARFWIVGLGGVGVQLAVIALLVGAGVHYLPATALAVGAAIVHNFLWHRRWTWRDRPASAPALAAFARFASANGMVSIVGNAIVMWILVGLAGAPPVWANAAAIGAAGFVNFLLADRVVFSTINVCGHFHSSENVPSGASRWSARYRASGRMSVSSRAAETARTCGARGNVSGPA
jgi:putative flippase GtrA